MPEQHVSDRLAEISARLTAWRDRDGSSSGETFQASEFDINAPDTYWLLEQFSDHRQIALSYEAQIQAQDQQIGALRAEQARLRTALTALAQSWRDDYEQCGHDYEMVCMPQCADELDALFVEAPSA